MDVFERLELELRGAGLKAEVHEEIHVPVTIDTGVGKLRTCLELELDHEGGELRIKDPEAQSERIMREYQERILGLPTN